MKQKKKKTKPRKTFYTWEDGRKEEEQDISKITRLVTSVEFSLLFGQGSK